MRVLGEQLGLSRAFYFRVERDDNGCAHVIENEYCRDAGQPSMIGRHSLKHFGSWLFEGLEQGRAVEIPDVAAVPGLAPEELASYRARGVAAFINVPLLRNGEYSAGITAHDTAPRAWRPAELAMIREVAVRTWDAMERAGAEEALRKSEARLALDLADWQQLQRISTRLIEENDIYQEILEAARVLMRSDSSTLQMLAPERNELFLLAQTGLAPESAKFWEWVRVDETTSCGLAFARREAVTVSDIELWELVAGTENLTHYRLSGIRATHSTPLISRDGRFIGVISTHWHEVHEPSERELRLLDVLARQVADLMEHRSAEEALRTAEQKFRLFVQNVHEYALVQTDPQGLITNWNPGAQRLFGYSTEQVLERDFSILLTPEDRAQGVFRKELAMMAAGQRNEDARWFVRQDGSRFWGRWISEPICDETGQFRGVAKIMRDETERQHIADVIQQSLAEKEELLKEVHHRVKNNLQVIVSLLNMQTSQIQDERILMPFQEARNRVLAISSIHELLYRSESFAGIALADYARQLAPGLVRFYGLESRVRLDVQGDGTKLELERAVPYGMLLNELISNACKHAFPAPNAGTITISVQPDGNRVELIVADTGQGLPDGFDYHKASSLGLKLVHGLVRQLGGVIEIHSKPGTTVKVRFPATRPKSDE